MEWEFFCYLSHHSFYRPSCQIPMSYIRHPSSAMPCVYFWTPYSLPAGCVSLHVRLNFCIYFTMKIICFIIFVFSSNQIEALIGIYFIIVVYSQFKAMKEEEANQRNTVVTAHDLPTINTIA